MQVDGNNPVEESTNGKIRHSKEISVHNLFHVCRLFLKFNFYYFEK